MIRKLLLLFIVGCASIPVPSDAQITSVPVAPKVVKNYDAQGRYVSARFYVDAQYRDSAGTFIPIRADWVRTAGKLEVTNGDRLFKLDTATSTFWYAYKDHWIGQELVGAVYYDDVQKDWTILANVTNGDWVRKNRRITRDNIMPGIDVTYRAFKGGAEELITMSENTRNNIPAPSTFGYTAANTWFGWIHRIHVDSLDAKVRWVRIGNDDGMGNNLFHRDSLTLNQGGVFNRKISERLDFTNADGSEVYFTLDPGIAHEPQNSPSHIPDRVQMTKYLIRKQGKIWMITGAKVLDLNALPAGPIIFDPSYRTPGTPGDCIMRGSDVHGNYYNLTENQWGSTSGTDKRRSIIRVPFEILGDSGYVPFTPDSTIARGWFYSGQKGNDTTLDAHLAVFLRSGIANPEQSGLSNFPDWNHQLHASPNGLLPWYLVGADSIDACITNNCADRHSTVTTTASSWADTNTWLEWIIPARLDTIWHSGSKTWAVPAHVMLYGDENSRDNRAVASINTVDSDGVDSLFHFIVYFTEVSPQVMGGWINVE